MRLLIVSNMTHYQGTDGRVVGWGPTVEEIDALATIFEEVRHVAFLHPGSPPPTLLPYRAPNVRFLPLPPSGGPALAHKVGILRRSPTYVARMLREFQWADVVFVRCPSNVGLIAIMLLAFCRRPRYRWAKYGGNWRPDGPEAWPYTLQRWWLNRGLHRGAVTVNGRWPGQPQHVYTFLNPCLSQKDVEQGRRAGEGKELRPPLYLLFVGRVEEAKGVGRILDVAKRLQAERVPFELHLVGDGPERPAFAQRARDERLAGCVTFHGWQPKPALAHFYQRAHILLFPSSSSEGWPKVLSEAMAYGVVPVAGAISSIPQVLAETGAGVVLPPHDVEAFVRAVLGYVNNPGEWRRASRAGMAAAERFTYDAYLRAVRQMFRDAWGVHLDGDRQKVRNQ